MENHQQPRPSTEQVKGKIRPFYPTEDDKFKVKIRPMPLYPTEDDKLKPTIRPFFENNRPPFNYPFNMQLYVNDLIPAKDKQ
jgi:hypothetical protein